jgi:Zn-dependent protease with chaperone function
MTSRWPLILGAAVLAGCAANPMTGRSQLMLVSEDSVIAQSKLAYAQELQPWDKKGKLNTDPGIKARIDTITGRLVAQAIRYRPETAKWDWQVQVIDEPKTLNAFCLPGGRMAIYTGLMEKLQATDDEIAQVMGHEIAHALANHGAEKMSRAMAAQGVVGVAAVLAGDKNQGLVMTGGTALAQLGWMMPNSRSAETEADRIGIELAARAGYDPRAGASLWKKMMAANGKGGPDWLSTHPSSEKRMQELAQLADYMQPIYVEAKAGPLPSYTPRMASNVRDVGPGAQQLAPAGLKPLTLVSPAFEDFKRGQAKLPCGDCSIKFQNAKDDLKKIHAQGKWEELAKAVLDVGYRQDISSYYLGIAAEGLGYPAAARQYFSQAVELAKRKETHCDGSFLNLCNGIQLPTAAEAALNRLGR